MHRPPNKFTQRVAAAVLLVYLCGAAAAQDLQYPWLDLQERCREGSHGNGGQEHGRDQRVATCIGTHPAAENTDGVDIGALIESRLRWDAYVDARTVDVQVTDGIVSLIGVVRSANEKKRAEEIALSSGGMAVNVDALQVARWIGDRIIQGGDVPGATDATVLSVIQNKLDAHRQIATENMDVQFSNGIATLRGTVDDLRSKRAAVELVLSVSGVEIVRDRLLVLDSNRVASEQELARRAHKY